MVCAPLRVRLVLITALATLAGTRAQADPPRYSVTNISDRAQGFVWSTLKINNAGQIMSEYSLWTPGQGTTNFDFSAFDINNHGQVAGGIGWCNGCAPGSNPATAVRWTAAGGIEPIGEGRAQAINNLGQVAGNSFPGDYRAWRWSAEQGRQDLRQSADSPYGFANDINDDGAMAGSNFSGGSAYRWSPGATVGEPITDDSAYAYGMNNRGQITGQLAALTYSAFLYTPGEGVRDLGRLPFPGSESGVTTSGRAVNNLGTVVGWATDDIDTDLGTAWLWTPQDGILNLNELVDESGRDLYLRNATSINDLGQIVGWAQVPAMDPENPGAPVIVPFLLTPLPEPGVVGLVVAMALMVAGRRRH